MHLYDSIAAPVRNPFQSGALRCSLLVSQLSRAVLLNIHHRKVLLCLSQQTENGKGAAFCGYSHMGA